MKKKKCSRQHRNSLNLEKEIKDTAGGGEARLKEVAELEEEEPLCHRPVVWLPPEKGFKV